MPAEVQGEQTPTSSRCGTRTASESLYGLGQRQEGKLDIKGYDFDLWQRNTVVEIPMFVSSRGYGILWDNTAPSKFGDVAPFEAIAVGPVDVRRVAGRPRLQGTVAPATGDYQFQTYSNGDTKVWLDGVLQIDHYKQNWATEYDQFKVPPRGRQALSAQAHEHRRHDAASCAGRRRPDGDTSLWSEVGDGIDYYFVYGPKLDRVVAGYRALTGQAPMLPRWAFGFWQSREQLRTRRTRVLDVGRGVPPRARSRSTRSCRTGSTGRSTRGARTSSMRRAIPDPDG